MPEYADLAAVVAERMQMAPVTDTALLARMARGASSRHSGGNQSVQMSRSGSVSTTASPPPGSEAMSHRSHSSTSLAAPLLGDAPPRRLGDVSADQIHVGIPAGGTLRLNDEVASGSPAEQDFTASFGGGSRNVNAQYDVAATNASHRSMDALLVTPESTSGASAPPSAALGSGTGVHKGSAGDDAVTHTGLGVVSTSSALQPLAPASSHGRASVAQSTHNSSSSTRSRLGMPSLQRGTGARLTAQRCTVFWFEVPVHELQSSASLALGNPVATLTGSADVAPAASNPSLTHRSSATTDRLSQDGGPATARELPDVLLAGVVAPTDGVTPGTAALHGYGESNQSMASVEGAGAALVTANTTTSAATSASALAGDEPTSGRRRFSGAYGYSSAVHDALLRKGEGQKPMQDMRILLVDDGT
ncbi:hypothetical protein EON62_01055 [archaeon]|nr:MAG: hypothetical protein EON62_01055 [archaeon]